METKNKIHFLSNLLFLFKIPRNLFSLILILLVFSCHNEDPVTKTPDTTPTPYISINRNKVEITIHGKHKETSGDSARFYNDYSYTFERGAWGETIQWERYNFSFTDHGYNMMSVGSYATLSGYISADAKILLNLQFSKFYCCPNCHCFVDNSFDTLIVSDIPFFKEDSVNYIYKITGEQVSEHIKHLMHSEYYANPISGSLPCLVWNYISSIWNEESYIEIRFY